MRAPFDLDDAASAEECGNRFCVESRRHHHDPEVVAREHRLFREGEREIGVNASLVELVDHHDLELAEQRVALQTRGEDSLRRDQELGPAAELPVEANLPSDFIAERPISLGRDSAREAPRCDATRLKDDRLPAGGEGWRNPRRLPRARRRDDHECAVFPESLDDLRNARVDGERLHGITDGGRSRSGRATIPDRTRRHRTTRAPRSRRSPRRRRWRRCRSGAIRGARSSSTRSP